MIAILCNSSFLSSEIALSVHPMCSMSFEQNNTSFPSYDYDIWLSHCLVANSVSVVFYESRFFVDPSRFRALSPNTRFILVSTNNEDSIIEEALVCGATAFLQKPLRMQEIHEVLTFATK